MGGRAPPPEEEDKKKYVTIREKKCKTHPEPSSETQKFLLSARLRSWTLFGKGVGSYAGGQTQQDFFVKCLKIVFYVLRSPSKEDSHNNFA